MLDLGLEVLCVSQFTLYHVMKGNKPDFHLAMGGEASRSMYGDFVEEVRRRHSDREKVSDGRFGAMMTVDIANDGPVTLEIESLATDNKQRQASDKGAAPDKEAVE